MALKKKNQILPITPSMRALRQIDRSDLSKVEPCKALTRGMSSTGGRNNLGRITSRHRGSASHKRLYRIIDFKRNKTGVAAIVKTIEYDPNRTAFIALIEYNDGQLSYILAPHSLKIGDYVSSGVDAEVKIGNALPLSHIPIDSVIHNVEMKPGKGAQIARSAGSYATLIGRDNYFAQVKLKSGEVRKIPIDCYATIGSVSNADHQHINLGKAGRSRWKGWRPHVRGVAMNPVDHPHGGGEGKTSGGRHPVTPWGFPTKGKKTRKNKTTSKFIIKKRK